MSTDARLANVAHLLGDPARAAMMMALMDGRAHTAKELAYRARIAASTASAHLAKLSDARLVAVARQGRHRYFRIESALVAEMIETLSNVAADLEPPRPLHRRGDQTLLAARTCYDHIAGRLGVALADTLQENGAVVLGEGVAEVTERGDAFFSGLGMDLAPLRGGHRIFCRACLDWTERRPHLAGALGAALCSHCLEKGWIVKVRDSRALTITETGRHVFAEDFGVDLAAPDGGALSDAA